MPNEIKTNKHYKHNLKFLAIGALVGGVLGALFGILQEYGAFHIPGVEHLIEVSPLGIVVTAIILGVIIGSVLGELLDLYIFYSNHDSAISYSEVGKLELHEEKLNISKSRVQTGEVNMHKEVTTEEKTFTVPVAHEELIIESKLKNGDTDTIRIPVMEEQVEIIKHPVALEDVSYHIEQFQENKSVTETVKKEKLNVQKDGFTTVVDKEIK